MVLFRGGTLYIPNTSSKFTLNQIYQCLSISLCGTSSQACVSGTELILQAPGMNKLSVYTHGARSFKWSLSLCQWMFSLTFQLTLCEGYGEVLEWAAAHARLRSRTTELQQLSVIRSSERPGLCWEMHLCLTLIRQLSGFPSLSPSSIVLLQRHLAPKKSFVKQASNCCLSGRFLNAFRQLYAHSRWVCMWTCVSVGEEMLPSSK